MVGRWGQELRAGDRLREAGGIVDSRDMGLLCWGSAHLAPKDMVWPSWGWGSGAVGPAVGTHRLDKMPLSGSGPSWAQASTQVDSAQHCQEWVHVWPIPAASRHLPCGHPNCPAV